MNIFCTIETVKKYANGITSWPLTVMFFFLTNAHEEEHVETPSSEVAHHKIKPATVLDCRRYKIGVDRPDDVILFVGNKDDKMVEETFCSSVQHGSCHCAYLAHKTKQYKDFAGNFL